MDLSEAEKDRQALKSTAAYGEQFEIATAFQETKKEPVESWYDKMQKYSPWLR